MEDEEFFYEGPPEEQGGSEPSIPGQQVPTEPGEGDEGDTSVDINEIVERVVERMTPVVQDSEGRIIAHTVQSMGDLGSVSLVADDYLQYMPDGAADAVSSYLTPFLWGLAAGFVAFLIGHLWESFMRLLGLAKNR